VYSIKVYDPVADKIEIGAVIKEMALLANEPKRHPVLAETGLYVFWGATVYVYFDEDDVPLSMNCTKFGKRKKNVWEPYGNWYGAYTLPAHRRMGYAYRLYAEVERDLVKAGCRRIKSLAGSSAGLGLHRALRHQCWGLTAENEVFVDSVLPGHEGKYTGLTPPQAPGNLMTSKEVDFFIKKGLRYDHGK